MRIGDIFNHRKENLDKLLQKRRNVTGQQEETRVEIKCPECGAELRKDTKNGRLKICPDCGKYLSLTPCERIELTADEDSFREMWPEMKTTDPVSFPGYGEKLEKARRATGQNDSVVTGIMKIYGYRAAVAVLDTGFFMGSMGTVTGEKITRLTEYAMKKKLPLIIFSASGGARMQEGLFSLMQMAKTSAAIERFKAAGGLYISVLCHPTTGGVSASFAFLGDIILAEPRALIGFAGSRVIEQTIGEHVPDEVRQAEAHVKNGMLDGIVERGKLKKALGRLLSLHTPRPMKKEAGIANWSPSGVSSTTDRAAYEFVQLARDKNRPGITDYIDNLFEHFIELKGDRLGAEDGSILGGIASFHGMPVTVIGHRKGKNLDENRRFHFGMASPEGYRKSLRLAKQAEKFGRPVICFIDTPGAYPGLDAEQHGQPAAIAENLAAFSSLGVPVIAVITGEGGSGGALALAVADSVWMLENSVYSILSPEGFAAILWKDAKRAGEASEIMKLTSREIYSCGIIDGILPEGDLLYRELDRMLCSEIDRLKCLDEDELLEKRYARYRKFGSR